MTRITDRKVLERLIAQGRVKGVDKLHLEAHLKSASKSKTALSNFSPLPPTLPVVRLYQALVTKYGRHANGGLMVYELGFAGMGRKYRLDMAIPFYSLGIELDGWAYHGKHLSSFARDRDKSLWFERRGWRVIRFSARQVNEGISDALQAIEEIMATCQVRDPTLWNIKHTAFDRNEIEILR